MIRGGTRRVPSSAGGENTVGPVNPRCRLISLFPTKNLVTSPGGALVRSQTAYTNLASVGSAVIDSLSLKKRGSVSRISVMGSPKWAPPSVDLLTRAAVAKVSGDRLTERLVG